MMAFLLVTHDRKFLFFNLHGQNSGKINQLLKLLLVFECSVDERPPNSNKHTLFIYLYISNNLFNLLPVVDHICKYG